MYRRILVPVDGSSASSRGLEEAIRLAKNQTARLRLVHVVDEYIGYQSGDVSAAGSFAADLPDSLRASGRIMLEKALAIVRKHGIRAESAIFDSIGGRVAGLIVREARSRKARAA